MIRIFSVTTEEFIEKFKQKFGEHTFTESEITYWCESEAHRFGVSLTGENEVSFLVNGRSETVLRFSNCYGIRYVFGKNKKCILLVPNLASGSPGNIMIAAEAGNGTWTAYAQTITIYESAGLRQTAAGISTTLPPGIANDTLPYVVFNAPDMLGKMCPELYAVRYATRFFSAVTSPAVIVVDNIPVILTGVPTLSVASPAIGIPVDPADYEED